jgi:hypothetical protein
MREFNERDWKVLRQLQPIVLERFCKRILDEIQSTSLSPSRSFHERYLDIYKLIHKRNEEISDAFDDVRRSNALIRIASMKALGLLSEEEFSQFSEETRNIVAAI